MKPLKEYAIYCEDLDGSERKFGHVFAKSEGHAKKIAKEQGCKKLTSAEELGTQKSSAQLVQEAVLAS